MLTDTSNKQIISLWIGKNSQQCAFNFYNLQVQQIFDDENDPISHASLWKNMKKHQPRMIIFDAQIQRLSAVRQVNNKKMLQKMKNQSNFDSFYGVFSQIDAKPLQSHETLDKDEWQQFNNWKDEQNNYFLINKSFTTLPKQNKQEYMVDLQYQRFQTYEQFYKLNQQKSEDMLRQQLQKSDFLKVFSICTDQNYSGYTSKIIQYLRYQCPKKSFLLCSLTNHSNLPIISLPNFYEEVDIITPININNLKYPFFRNKKKFAAMLAPYLSTLITPFAMKQTDPHNYVSTIMTDNRKLFNSAYCLPIIDEQSNLNQNTNIFRYQEAFSNSLNETKRQPKRYEKQDLRKPKNDEQQQQNLQLRINFTNDSYLSLTNSKKKGKFISQSYILKGHFNNFEKLFKPKTEPSSLSIKYIQAIFSAPQQPQNLYDKFYQHWYGQIVQSYPFHMVMFNHQIFGNSIRQNLSKSITKTKIFNQQLPQYKEKVLSIADLYLQLNQQSD